MRILRLRFLMERILGNKYKPIRELVYKFLSPIKLKINKKIEHQPIVNKEKGFVLDGTLNNYLTFHLRPKKSSDFNLVSTEILGEKIGIIIQGNIGKNFNFLKETLKIYEKIFPKTLIIVSTWKSEDQKKILNLQKENIKILFNEEPTGPSPGNIDHQIISTFNGLTLAKKLGVEFCLKQRTDCRINKSNAFSYLISLIKHFPVEKNKPKLKGRIISTSLNTTKYRLFNLSDFLLFGYVDDLLIYFDKTSYLDSLKKYNFGNKPCFIDDTPVVSEIFLCARYLKEINNQINWNLDFWWKSLKEYFCIIDAMSLDLIWLKYDWEFEYRYSKSYSNKIVRGIEFSDWFALYSNMNLEWKKYLNEHEKFDDKLTLKNYKY